MCKVIKNQECGKRIWDSVKSWAAHQASRILYPPSVVIISIAVIAYFIRYIVSLIHLETVESPLALAGVSIALGGFILLGAFYQDKAQAQNALSNKFKKTAKLFLIAAVCFVIAFLFLQWISLIEPDALTRVDWAIIVLTAFVISIAAVTFAVALSFLLCIIKKL